MIVNCGHEEKNIYIYFCILRRIIDDGSHRFNPFYICKRFTLGSVHYLWLGGGGGGISHRLPPQISHDPPPPKEKTKNFCDPTQFYIKYSTSV